MTKTSEKLILERLSYLETALENYGAQIRGLNDAVSQIQIDANSPEKNTQVANINTSLEGYETQIRSLNDAVSELQKGLGIQMSCLNEAVSNLQLSTNQRLGASQNVIDHTIKSRRLFQPKVRSNLSTSLPKIESAMTFDQQLEHIKSLGYSAYEKWFELLEPNLVSYNKDPAAGISIEENTGARLFRDFIAPYAQGSVLDIGCGIANMPAYLSDFEQTLIAGSDPLSPELDRNFSFYHGLAELLPWKDNSFDNVVIGTSMDHFLDPYRALDEAKRVLKPNGILLLWMGFVSGGKQYDPFAFDAEPVDEFHLFHFDKDWFDPMIQDKFSIRECIPINEVSSFYACTLI